jgi:hypothetical protein
MDKDDGGVEEDWDDVIAGYKDRLVGRAQRTVQYASSRVDVADHSLIIYGVGAAPADIADLLHNAPRGLTARWVCVPYSST